MHEFLVSYSRVLGGALRLMLGFRIFQRLCSWSFMYEFHNFTIWSTDESIFDISCNAYSLNVYVTYMCSMFSVTVPMLLFHLICCSHALCHCIQVSLMIRMFISIWYSDWFICDRLVCVIFGLFPDLPTYSCLPEKHPFAYCMGLLWCTLLCLFWCWSFLCISLQ